MKKALHSIEDVLRQLELEGLIPQARIEEIYASLTSETSEPHSPWYVRALVGISAWISAMLFLTFAYGTKLITSPFGSIILGIILIAGVVVLKRAGSKALFLDQLALAACFSGQILLISGIAGETNTSVASVSTILIEAALIALYPDRIHRFASTLIAAGAALVFLYDIRVPNLINALVITLAAFAGYAWKNEARFSANKYSCIHRPVSYGLVFGLLAVLVLSIVKGGQSNIVSTWAPSTIGLTIIFMCLEYSALSFHGASFKSGISLAVFAGTAFLAVPAFESPGIIAALFVLALGYSRGNRILMGLALGFIILFVSAFYYDLQVTLLTKSYMLAGTGSALLLLRYSLLRQLKHIGEDVI